MARAASWFTVLAAFALIGVSLGSFYFHRHQLDVIAARHLRLVVAGPGSLRADSPNVFNLLTTRVTGEPCATQIEWSLSTSEGKRLVDRKDTTDNDGRLVMTVPADMELPRRPGVQVQLTVTATRGGDPVQVVLPLPVRPACCLTALRLDRQTYRPGETIRYRSVTVSRCNLAADYSLPIEFEVMDPKSAPVAGSRLAGLTERGVGNGEFRLPDSLAPGTYALVVRSADGVFPEARLAFVVAEKPSPAPPTKPEAGKSSADAVAIEFFPEGGRLAAAIPNGVYFAARDREGRPVEIQGEVIDGKGEKVVAVASVSSGLGRFAFTPSAAETYRLKLTPPNHAGEMAVLPPAVTEQPIALSAGTGVFASGSPLELTLRAAKDNLPLLVTARVRDILVGQQVMLSAAADAGNGKKLLIPLDDRVAGVVRVTVYDCTKKPPAALAERFVYRQPRRLVVRATESRKPAGELTLAIDDEKGRPVPAVVGGTVVDGADANPAEGQPASLMCNLLTDGVLPVQGPGCLDLHAAGTEAGAAAIDLALGSRRVPVVAEAPPAVYDNLGEIRTEYDAALSEYRAKRTHVVNALIMLSFFGGLALALAVTMLALFRMVEGSRLLLPTAGAMLCCAIVTTVSNDPSRMEPVEAAAVGFAPYTPPQTESPAAESRLSDEIRALAEKLRRSEADPEELKRYRFALRSYPPRAGSAQDGKTAAGLVAWQPLLVAGANGRVAIPGVTPVQGKPLRVTIDVHGDGRVGSCELLVKP